MIIIIYCVSFGVCGANVPDASGKFVYRPLLHGRHDPPTVDRLGHQRLANVQPRHSSSHGLGAHRLLDRSRKRKVNIVPFTT